MMRGLRPIPLRLLAEDSVVRVPDGDGGYAEGVAVSHVRFARTQSVVDDGHRSADAGSGKVYTRLTAMVPSRCQRGLASTSAGIRTTWPSAGGARTSTGTCTTGSWW